MNRIEFGDCREIMRRWAADGVRAQTCVTSPPYFGLRDYGHEGQIGLEATPDEYVAKLVEVFRCVRDVLADDGTLWLNLGDSYTNNIGKTGGYTSGVAAKGTHGEASKGCGNRSPERSRALAAIGLKEKDLIGIPWRVAFALQADGWYLRQDIIWHKPNPMPESVTDRCTKAHEYIFLLSKGPRYFFDSDAMKEPAIGALAGNTKPTKAARAYADGAAEHRTAVGLHKWAERQRNKRDGFKRDGSKSGHVAPGQSAGVHREDREDSAWDVEKRNRRSVWTVATRPYKGAHFATFPPDLITPCVLAGAPAGGVVLDPFMGSGTTAAVAKRHGRQYLGCELNRGYEPLQQERINEPDTEQADSPTDYLEAHPAQMDLLGEMA